MAPRLHVATCLLAHLLVAAALAGPAAAAPVESPIAPGERGLRLGFVADAQETGSRPELRAALADLDGWGAERLLYGGDTSYGYEDAPRDWREAMSAFEGRTLFVYGNHDDGEAYARYQPRANESWTWWAWERDDVVVIGLDTNSPLRNGTPQREWLGRTLAAHRDDVVILAMHVSWWAPNVYHKPNLDFPGSARDMDALVREHRVDLVLGAHEHYYARWDRAGVPYVVNGAVEAQTRDVPPQVIGEAERTTSQRTWMRLEIVDCGVAGWTLTPRDGEALDAFFIPLEGARGGIHGETAYCDARASSDAVPPPRTEGAPPSRSDAEPDEGDQPDPGDDDAFGTQPLLPRLLLGGALLGGIGGAAWMTRRRRL